MSALQQIITTDLSLCGIVGNSIDVDTVFGIAGDVEQRKGSLVLGLVLLNFWLIGVGTHAIVI